MTTTRPRTSRDRQREETRVRVYTEALEVFRREGFARARIEEIAERAGVSRGAFYFHFPTKEDVLKQLLHERQRQLVEALVALPSDVSLRDTMLCVARVIASSWQDEPALLGEVGVVALRITASELPDLSAVHPSEGALVARFEAAIARGELPSALPGVLLADFFLVNQFTAALAWSRSPSLPLDAVLTQVVDFFLRGLGLEPSSLP